MLFFVGIGILLGSIFLTLMCLKVRKWMDVPDVTYLIKEYMILPYDDVLKRNAGGMVNAVTVEEKQNNRKAKFIQWS
jgi:hypothetical protein